MESFVKRYVPFLLVLFIVGCAYYNTFFNAKQNYNQGQQKQKNTKSEQLPADVKKHYNTSIEKSWKLIDVYGDSSKYADDALLLIGKSHYQLEEYNRAERIFDQFLKKYLNSEFIPEVKLWLGKTYIKLERDEEALELYSALFDQKISKDIAAESFYYLGELQFERGNYEPAIENFQKCVRLEAEEEIAGAAQYRIAQAFYKRSEYENAIHNYDKVLDYDLPYLEHYQALLDQSNAYIRIGDFANAEQTLKFMLRDQRFKEQFGIIEAKLGNIYEFEGEIGLAKDYYEEVIERYPRTEGAALAYYYLGQLYEKEFGNMDSAKVKYEQVKRSYSKSEAVEDAEVKQKVLGEYLKLRDRIRKDLGDLYKLSIGDSTLIDSIVTGQDTIDIRRDDDSFANVQDPFGFDRDSVETDTTTRDSLREKPKVVQKKQAISRTPEDVEKSLFRTRYDLAEFFMFKYQQYDSAEYAYKTFIRHHSDSVLTPKAFYALYYLYNDIKKDTASANVMKDSIITNFPETVYARKLTNRVDITEETDDEVEQGGKRYRQAELYMENKNYEDALALFNRIAVEDSGSAWAQKSRFATAWIYEKLLRDTSKAIDSYTVLANEYPKTEYGKIAVNKIRVPVEETVSDSLSMKPVAPDSASQVLPDSTISEDQAPFIPETDEKPEDEKGIKPDDDLRQE